MKKIFLMSLLLALFFFSGRPINVKAVSGSKAIDVALGFFHSCALLEGGIVKCWGYNVYGQLGLEDAKNRGGAAGEMGSNLPLVKFGDNVSVTALFSGSFHNCVILSDKSLKCWGYNKTGQLGLGDSRNHGDRPSSMGNRLPPVNLGKNRTAVSLALGKDHSCVILDDNHVKCWGNNSLGQLGLPNMKKTYGSVPNTMGDQLPAVDLGTTKKVKMLSAGDSFSCALIEDGSVLCWGTNLNGAVPREVTTGGDYKPFLVSLGTGRAATSISSGVNHTCATLDDYTVKCWGYNIDGQLGVEDTTNRGDTPNQMGDALPVTSLAPSLDLLELKCGGFGCCASFVNNAEKCWGYNVLGQLGAGDTMSRGTKTGQMGNELPFVDFGINITVVKIAAGQYHNCALLSDGSIRCWGYNFDGELGLGDTTNRGVKDGDMGPNLPGIEL